jgi:diguanylate cyclase (GGDEF)-like protein
MNLKKQTLLIISAIIYALFALNANAVDRKVRAGGSELRPLVYIDAETGKPSGIVVLLTEEIARQSGWDLEWVMDDWAVNVEKIKNNELDLLVGVGYSDERAKFMDYNDESVMMVWGQLYGQQDSKIENILELEGKKIGRLRNGISGKNFEGKCKDFEIKCQFVELADYDAVFTALQNKEIEAGVVNNLFGYELESQYTVRRLSLMFNPFKVLYSVPKDSNLDILLTIDSKLSAWKEDGDSYYYDVTRKWAKGGNVEAFPEWLIYVLVASVFIIITAFIMVTILRSQVHKRTEELTNREFQFRQIINLVPHMIFASDKTGRMIFANRATSQFFGKHPTEFEAMTRQQVADEIPMGVALLKDDEKIVGKTSGNFTKEITLTDLQSKQKSFQLSKVPFVGRGDVEPAVVSVAVDVTEQRLAHQKIQHMAHYDKLTNIPNRTLLLEKLNLAIKKTKQYGTLGALLRIDLDRFKSVNDTLGHAMGDLIIQSTANRIKKCCREVDTFGRVGGNEFLIVLQDIGSDADQAAKRAFEIVKKVRHETAKSIIAGKHEVQMTCSIGYILFPIDADNSDLIIQRVDTALFQAKARGRDCVVQYRPKMEQEIIRRQQLSTDLKQALKLKQIYIEYQAIVDRHSQKIVGAEALLRWNHNVHGLIMPKEFVNIAEENGTIVDISNNTFDCASMLLQDISKLTSTQSSSTIYDADFFVSFNLSAKQIRPISLKRDIACMIKEFQIEPKRIQLEVTESVLMQDWDLSVEVLNEVKELGVNIAIDDFGGAHLGFDYIRQLPLDKLKIDGVLVEQIEDGDEVKGLISLMIQFAKEIGVDIVAEATENEAQIAFLQQEGCNQYQGYYYSRPVPYEEFESSCQRTIKDLKGKA